MTHPRITCTTSALAAFASVFLLTGCLRDPPDYTLYLPLEPAPDDRGERDGWGKVKGTHLLLDLREPDTIAGRALPAKSRLEGLQIRGRTVLDLEYEDIIAWRSDFAFARHHGEATYSHHDFTSGRSTATPFHRVIQNQPDKTGKIHGRVGVIDQDEGLARIAVLGPDGRMVTQLDRVLAPPLGAVCVGHPLGAGGWIVSHRDDQGRSYDIIYNQQGTVLSPPLTGISVFRQDDSLQVPLYALRCHPTRVDLYWPILPDGTFPPKPGDLVGLRPLTIFDGWVGWAVVWTKPEGERVAVVTNPDFAQILGSRDRAEFTDLKLVRRFATGAPRGTLTAIVSVAGIPGWRILDLPQWTEVVPRIYANAKQAEEAVQEIDRQKSIADHENWKLEHAAYLRQLEENRQRSRQLEATTDRARFEQEERERARAAARQQAGSDALYWSRQFEYLTGQKW